MALVRGRAGEDLLGDVPVGLGVGEALTVGDGLAVAVEDEDLEDVGDADGDGVGDGDRVGDAVDVGAAATVSVVAHASPAAHWPPFRVAAVVNFVPPAAVAVTVASKVAVADVGAPLVPSAGTVHVRVLCDASSIRPLLTS